MFKHTFKNIIYTSSIAAILLIGCKKPNDPKPTATPLPGANGFYVVNEGAFQGGNASLSFFDKTTQSMTNDYYFKLDSKNALGDQAQSMSIYKNKGYVVVQNSNKVEVVDMTAFTTLGVLNIPATTSPRYFLGVNENTGYLTDWKTNSVLVINLTDKSVTASIAVGTGPDQMILTGNKVYVANKGGFGNDNKISVINPATNSVENIITVDDMPNSMVLDKDNKLWVLCGGNKVYGGAPNYTLDLALSSKGSLVKINLSNNTVEQTMTFPSIDKSPSSLTINKDGNKLLYNYEGKVFGQDITATILNRTPLINREFYGLSFDPSANQIIACFAPNYTSAGKIIRYNFSDNTQAIAIDSFTVGVNPSSIVFK